MRQYSESLNNCNSESHISSFCVLLSNGRMETNDEIRRQRLEIAIKRTGSAAKLAELVGTSAAYLSQIKNQTPDSKTGKPKTMGDDLARRIETAIGERTGWMDAAHAEQVSPQPTPLRWWVTEDEYELLELYRETDADGRQTIKTVARGMPKESASTLPRVNKT